MFLNCSQSGRSNPIGPNRLFLKQYIARKQTSDWLRIARNEILSEAFTRKTSLKRVMPCKLVVRWKFFNVRQTCLNSKFGMSKLAFFNYWFLTDPEKYTENMFGNKDYLNVDKIFLGKS